MNLYDFCIKNSMNNILEEWHPLKNGDLTQINFTSGSRKKVWGMFEQGHEWQAIIENRTLQKQNCPYCSGNRVLALPSAEYFLKSIF